ncbi:MAG: dimethyl sulfoxide reductase anchor subunit [gamma proteobacterium symbiont of Bathyaustriella thionipta]|nr:dimethyl sulfoxide reductase anchor subunit [gamma proteobacterium symbiont of Bathyaustriella thionipta]MCU7951550.1 dimethyl sulfoxide reductase anchor subunit [gamma proteobacterium symbiont of Bathyaustriella thionipta]MCU7952184.1 dimethyl sulfoxide reductase anchor subunit [gamma proteobacterium symbiont of Bathyaustriella thionipta]MCU7958146.1 dimethyl sulfoxide reductase anchor subunit [gamma proteobacterium symbiont of Bathyaustriella thionipta]MCU7967745.1 dimethyl sulfoxide reduc
MQPAFSVIFLTTLIGMGQGLFLAIYTEQVYSVLNVVEKTSTVEFYSLGSAVALLLLILGLMASIFHLGRPERAWRAASMWRTSWLSREVIILPTVMGFIFLYGLVHFMDWNIIVMTFGAVEIDLSIIIGALTTLFVFSLYIATGMIYACLKFLQEWHSPLTVINYLLLGSASGFTLATFIAAYKHPELISFFAGWSIVLLVLSFIFRGASLIRNKRLRPKSTVQTAIGVRHNKIKQKSMGFMGGSMNTRDFFHGKTRRFLKSIKTLFLLMVFAIPLTMLILAFFKPSITILGVAIASMYIGLLAERWYFFAEGNHPQNIYYQSIA